MDVFVANFVSDHSALDLGLFLLDQAKPDGHKRVDVGRLKKGTINVICLHITHVSLFHSSAVSPLTWARFP